MTDLFPEILDFGAYKPYANKHPGNANDWYWQLGYVPYTPIYLAIEQSLDQSCVHAFAGALEMGSIFYFLRRHFAVNKAIETGTCHGATTRFFGTYFEEVHTMELDSGRYAQAAEDLEDYPNVRRHLGTSPQLLRQILPTMKGDRLLCYLDAHWNAYWPLLDEIAEIGKTHKDNAIIVIDDVQVDGRTDVDYDAGCHYNYFKNALDLAFSSYSKHWIIPSNPMLRAKFCAIPKVWSDL